MLNLLCLRIFTTVICGWLWLFTSTTTSVPCNLIGIALTNMKPGGRRVYPIEYTQGSIVRCVYDKLIWSHAKIFSQNIPGYFIITVAILPRCQLNNPIGHCLTHWGRDEMAAVSQTTLSNAFSWMEMLEFRLRFHWYLFPGVQLTIFKLWFR